MKQDNCKIIVKASKMNVSCLKQGQGLKASGAHLYPNFPRVQPPPPPPPPFHRAGQNALIHGSCQWKRLVKTAKLLARLHINKTKTLVC